jgi:hypothetical protein
MEAQNPGIGGRDRCDGWAGRACLELKRAAIVSEVRAGVVRADWEICATGSSVSPDSAGLRRGVFAAPGFRRAEGFGDTRMLSCVILRRIEFFYRVVNVIFFDFKSPVSGATLIRTAPLVFKPEFARFEVLFNLFANEPPSIETFRDCTGGI